MGASYLALQNGSDVRGVAVEGVAGEEVNLTPIVAKTIAKAFARFLSNRLSLSKPLRISVGRDSRISGPAISKAVCESLCESGCLVYDFGLASTPAMFMSTVTPGHAYDGAIMLTASHLPYNRNGLKFFTSKGGLEKQDITEILKIAESGVLNENTQNSGKIEPIDFMETYAQGLVDVVRRGTENVERPLLGFKIVVDAGNGAGGFFAKKVLEPLGADITGSQFLEPDGMFPNHVPNPESQVAMDAICVAVKKNKADLGIIFDTDVDRAAAVDEQGNQINRNRLIALMSAIVLDEHPGSVIVTDSVTSDGLAEFIEGKLQGRHHRFKRGYKNVINEAIRLNGEGQESWLAIETSGHAAMKENYFLDDGAYLMAKLLIKLAGLRKEGKSSISELFKALKEPKEECEFRARITATDFVTCGKEVLGGLPEFCSSVPGWSVVPRNFEGVRIACDAESGDGWLLLRMSLHDPVLPLNIESNCIGGVKQIAEKLLPYLSKFTALDISSLRSFLG